MKRFKFNFRQPALSHRASLLTLLVMCFAFNVSTVSVVSAQRRGGAVHGGYHHYVPAFRGHFGGHFGPRYIPYRPFMWYPAWGGYYWGISPFALRFRVDRYNYYFDDGIYLRMENGKFKVVPAPVGHRIRELPSGANQIEVNGEKYYYYYGTYYAAREGQYEVVQPPVGAIVGSIPPGYDKLVVNGETYYVFNGVQYKAIILRDEVWYEVIKNSNIMAVPAALPRQEMIAPADSTGNK